MKEVIMFQSEDGRVYDTAEQAYIHDAECEFLEWIEKHENYYAKDINDKSYLFRWLRKNKEDIIKMLNDSRE